MKRILCLPLQHEALALLCTALLLPGSAAASQREVIRSSWNGFQQQVTERKLKGGNLRVTLAGGAVVKTKLIRIEETGLIVKPVKATRQWAAAAGEAKIPREQIKTVRFHGRSGHGRLIGVLGGLGAGAGIAAGATSGVDTSEGVVGMVVGIAIFGAALGGLIAGYYIGRAMDKPAPEFVMQ
jgi:ABC-type dipeptide/oligopeptide/nickel transport system permease subunit